VLTLHPVLPMRAAVVAGATAALGLLALASLSATPEPPRAGVVQAAAFPGPIASANVVREPFALTRSDSLTR
jgi:hypothetical protein